MSDEVKAYRDPTEAESRAMALATERQVQRPTRARLKVKQCAGGVLQLTSEHGQVAGWIDQLQEALGTTSTDFVQSAHFQLESVLRIKGDVHASMEAVNSSLALIEAVGAANEVEGAMAVQIACNHAASLKMLARSQAHAEDGQTEAAAAYVGMATKLTRNMTTVIEALAKLRGGGKQIVEHRYITVTAENAVVGDNTSAVFGGVHQGGNSKNVRQPRESLAIAHTGGETMLGKEPGREALPSSGPEGEIPLSATRRMEPRRAARASQRSVQGRAPNAGTSGSPAAGEQDD